MTTMDSDPIQDHILENKDNLLIAAEVSDAWLKVRKKLGLDFLDGLERALQLKKELKGEWKFEKEGCPFENSWASFDFSKPAWKNEYFVSLCFGDYGHDVYFGLSRDYDKPSIKKRSRCAALLAAVKEHYTSSNDSNYWEACVSVPSIPGDWGKPDVLWSMHDEKDELLNKVAEHLLKVAKISTPFVDQLAGKK